jgi:hypothetical protein
VLTIAAIRAADARARARFTYRADGPQDEWRSHADEVEAGRAWADDCDGLASTVLDLLCRAGCPLDHAFRMAVSSTGSGTADHMIGCVQDDQGDFWIVGDTFHACYAAGACRHQPIEYNRLDEHLPDHESLWRDGAPFERANPHS